MRTTMGTLQKKNNNHDAMHRHFIQLLCILCNQLKIAFSDYCSTISLVFSVFTSVFAVKLWIYRKKSQRIYYGLPIKFEMYWNAGPFQKPPLCKEWNYWVADTFCFATFIISVKKIKMQLLLNSNFVFILIFRFNWHLFSF